MSVSVDSVTGLEKACLRTAAVCASSFRHIVPECDLHHPCIHETTTVRCYREHLQKYTCMELTSFRLSPQEVRYGGEDSIPLAQGHQCMMPSDAKWLHSSFSQAETKQM